MAVRFYGEFRNDAGDDFRINIYDDQFINPATEQIVAVPGFTLTYEGNNQDQYQPIIPSRLDFTWYNEGGDFDTWLNTVLPASEEGRFLVELVHDYGELSQEIWWRGVLLPEQVQIQDEAQPSAVNFTAGDDLPQLKEFTVENVPGTGYKSLINYIHFCLSKTRQHALYANSDLFLRYFNDFYPSAYTGSDLIGEIGVYEPTIPGTEPTEFYNCYDVLRSIAISLNARIFQAKGAWYFLPMNKFQQRADNVAFTGDMYARTADNSVSTWSTIDKISWVTSMELVNGTDVEKMTGNVIEYSRPVKRVERQRIIKANEWLFQYNTNFTTLSGTANDIELADDDRTYFAGSTHLITLNYNVDIASQSADNNFINNHTVRADFTIKFGTQYYTDTGWSSSAGTKRVVIGQYFKNNGFESIGQLSVQVPELVSDQVGLDVTLNVVVLNGAGGDITGSLPTHNVLFILRVFPGDSADQLGDEVVYSSETNLDNQVVLGQDAVIMGNAQVSYSTGVAGVDWGSGSYIAASGLDTSEWYSSQDTTGYSLHRLGVREILENTQLPHRIRQGQYAHISSGVVFWPYHLVNEDSDFHVIHESSYSANDNISTVERFELNKSTSNVSFRSDGYNSNNPRDKFVPNGNAYADVIATSFDDLLTGRRAHFAVVQEITHSNGSSYTIDVDDNDGYMYMNGYTGANGFGRVYLPKVADNEGRIFRFKTDATISANTYYQVSIDSSEISNGVRIDGANFAQMDRPYDGIMVLCYDGQWYIIQRKSK